jgi:uncharacterized YigZ family protein
MPLTTRTIARGGVHEIEISKSRFICSVERTPDEGAARAFIDATRKRFWDASHNCWAFRIGERGDIQRSSDDGEPSGTAGVPMLDVLRKRDLVDVTAVVTRYFGGTMLGTGGLIRAYGRAVSDTISEVGIVERQPRHRLDVSIGYPDAGRIEHSIRTSPYALADVVYGDTQVTFALYLETARLPVVKTWLAELTNGSASVIEAEVMWIDVPVTDQGGQDEAE